MKKASILLALALFTLGGFAQQKDHLVVQFDFSKADGTTVTDNVSGINGKLTNPASVLDMGAYKVLSLGNGVGYFNMTSEVGGKLRQMDEFSISTYYRVDKAASLSGNGFFLWAFAQSSSTSQTSGAYIAYRLNAQRMATSAAGWGGEVGMEIGTAAEKGCWTHVLYRQKGQTGELFIDGRRVCFESNMPLIKSIFSSNPAYCWIGRAPFDGDSYLKQTLVSDFRLYDIALTDAEVYALSLETKRLEQEYRYGSQGDMTALNALLKESKDFIAAPTEGIAPNILAELQDDVTVLELEIGYKALSQTAIDDWVKSLTTALNKAKNAQKYEAKKSFDYKPGQQGFVHPGGLVSQNDIDRAKRLIFEEKNDYMIRAWNILCANEYSRSDIATWPTEVVVRGGGVGENYINCARGAAMAYQNALRWKIGGTKENADAAVRIMMQWARQCKALGGDTNVSLASGIYGHEFANAAELMRDYEGWSPEDFEEFKQWIIRVFYNPAIDFLRRRHDTWLNARYANLGERPGHYWSNWGLCNALCVMSIGILCDDVHMYNQGVSFYKYDHVGTFRDRSSQKVILNDGCDEFIGNLVPVVLPDERGPFGYLGQMQESGRDQGHSLMALGLALDICQVGFNQGDDLFAYMNDRIAAGTEFVAAMNFGGVDATSLPWITYNYADCRGTMGAGWAMGGPNTGGSGEYRPYWDRAIGYYEGLRGVKLQYAEKASAKVCPDGGGGNYSQNSGGFDHLGFSTLTSWRPAVEQSQAIVPLSGDIIYKGETYKNQTNLGGLKYKYTVEASRAIPADDEEIRLVPQLPDSETDTGNWEWNIGETTREITVHADHSYLYRVTYTAANGTKSQQSFAIAVCGDAQAEPMTQEITANGKIAKDDTAQVLMGSSLTLYAGAVTGWTDDYQWDNGAKQSTITIPNITTSRDYTCQYANQSGAVSTGLFHIDVVPAQQMFYIDGSAISGTQIETFPGSNVICLLQIPQQMQPENVVWQDGTVGTEYIIANIQEPATLTATYQGKDYTFSVSLKEASHGYYDILTTENGYTHITSLEQLTRAINSSYFVLCSDEADLMLGLANAKENGNKALHYQTPVNPLGDCSKVFTMEAFDGGYCLRNIDYDGLLLQTEMDAPQNLRTHDQPYPIFWARLLLALEDNAWTIENGTYTGNFLGLWFPENGYHDGEETALNKTGDEVGHFQLFAIDKERFHHDFLNEAKDATVLIQNPAFDGNSWALWTVTGTFGNQRFNGAAETWHSTNFSIQQTLKGVPAGTYTVTCQLVNGEGKNTGYLFATSGSVTEKSVVEQSCAGSDFDTQRNKMAANAEYGLRSVSIALPEDGDLTFGLKEPTNGTTWLVFDNFRLAYNPEYDSINDVLNEDEAESRIYYDFTGRRISTKPASGFYIQDGKKYFIK
ncbi:MAG: alginate lyase family protein [Prevotellaceae bacterium]|nr:alginate lyase family protein [Prevotellaceae bacterium]